MVFLFLSHHRPPSFFYPLLIFCHPFSESLYHFHSLHLLIYIIRPRGDSLNASVLGFSVMLFLLLNTASSPCHTLPQQCYPLPFSHRRSLLMRGKSVDVCLRLVPLGECCRGSDSMSCCPLSVMSALVGGV